MKSIIRHGSTPPTSNDLDEYQLGFCNSNNLLYIKNVNGEIVPLNDLQSIRNYIDEVLSNGSSNKNEFVGTQAEWDALTAEEQNSYDIAYIKKEGNDRTLNEFIGTQEEWDALTAEEQNVYDIAYIKKSEVEASVSSSELPLGAWMSFENDTAPNSQWIKAGTTFDENEYPDLYLYLGGTNIVPERFDHNVISDTETGEGGIISRNANNPTIMQYDGFLTVTQETSNTIMDIFKNGVKVARNGAGSTSSAYKGYSSSTIPFMKGDSIYTSATGQNNLVAFTYYKKPMFIKATSVADAYLPSDAVIDIKDYTKDYVDAKNSYSTTETLTGGTWIDGKPIYRKAYHFNAMLSVGQNIYTMNVGQADFDTLIKTYYIGRRSNMTDVMTAYFPTWTAENYTALKISVNDNEAMFVDYIILEYTKKTYQ